MVLVWQPLMPIAELYREIRPSRPRAPIPAADEQKL
jgi:hypothetical protein